jgi:hypothetical protein
MRNDLLSKAKRLREGREANEEAAALRLEEKSRAYRDLDERAYYVSLGAPKIAGDSHAKIQADREALDELPTFDLTDEAEAEIGRRLGRHE